MKKPQHILHILPYLETGGTEKHVLTLITTLRNMGLCQGEVLAPPGPFASQLQAADIPLTTFKYASEGLVASWRSFRPAFNRLAAQADLVHVHGAPDLLLFAAMAPVKRPRLLTVHGFHGKGAHVSYRFAAWLGNRLAAAIICVVGSEEKLLLAAGAKPGKLHRIYNGVADPTIGASVVCQAVAADQVPGADQAVAASQALGADQTLGTRTEQATVRIAFIGRLSPVKGVDVLLQALALLKKECTAPMRIDIMGEGPQAAALQEMAHTLGLGTQVVFHGYCSDAVARLAECDIFCLPSREDMGPLVCAEAMAQSKPVISTWVGGIPEMVQHNETGILIPSDDVPALAKALGRLVGDEKLRQKMGQVGRQRYEANFAQESMARRTYDIYCSIS